MRKLGYSWEWTSSIESLTSAASLCRPSGVMLGSASWAQCVLNSSAVIMLSSREQQREGWRSNVTGCRAQGGRDVGVARGSVRKVEEG